MCEGTGGLCCVLSGEERERGTLGDTGPRAALSVLEGKVLPWTVRQRKTLTKIILVSPLGKW